MVTPIRSGIILKTSLERSFSLEATLEAEMLQQPKKGQKNNKKKILPLRLGFELGTP